MATNSLKFIDLGITDFYENTEVDFPDATCRLVLNR